MSGVAYESVHSLAIGHVIRVWLYIINVLFIVQFCKYISLCGRGVSIAVICLIEVRLIL